MDILIDADLAVSLCTATSDQDAAAAEAVAKASNAGLRLWLYAGSIQAIESRLADTLQQQAAARTALKRLVDQGINWLAALAEDANVLDDDNIAAAQLLKAAARLGDNAKILTENQGLQQTCDKAISPEDFLALDLPPAPINFIDLKTQQDVIRPEMESRIHRILHHGQYILGAENRELEERLADYVGVKHCIGVSSGTDALLIPLMALGIGHGDEVITVSYTWISTAETIALLGARPVFVDIDPVTYNMDPALLEAAITPRTKAIMPVGIYGQCADMDAINAIADKHGLPVIEDAAQSFGATYNGRKSCALSTVGCTSFFPSKPLGGYGDGGAVFTDDDDLATLMKQIRVHGQAEKHCHPVIGINGRLDSLQAAVVLSKLDHFDDEIQRRQHIADRFAKALEGTTVIAPTVAKTNTSVWAQYTVQAKTRDTMQTALSEQGIPSVAYYVVPLHLQPVFADLGNREGDFPVTEQLGNRCLSLPMSPGLRKDEIDRICKALRSAASA